MTDDKDDGKPFEGKVLPFPGNSSSDLSDMGADYAIRSADGELIGTQQIVDLKKVEREYYEREDYVSQQALVQAVKNKSSPLDLADVVIMEVAEELSHLKWERQKQAKSGKSSAVISTSRIIALKQLSEIITKRLDSARNERLDLRSPRFQQVLNLWMKFIYESMEKSGIPSESIDLVFNQMKADMLDWEQKIINLSEQQI